MMKHIKRDLLDNVTYTSPICLTSKEYHEKAFHIKYNHNAIY
jgi:hypothetical protein